MKFKSIASRLIVSVLPIIAACTLVFVILTYVVSKNQMDRTINDKMRESLNLADSKISGILNETARVSHDLALYAGACGEQNAETPGEFDIKKRDSAKYLEEMISSYVNIMGGGIWYNKNSMPEGYGPDNEFYSHYVFLNGTAWEYVADYSEGGANDFHYHEWYVEPPAGETHWSNVYFDPVAQIPMITSTYAFYGPEGNWLGVTTADMALDAIQKIAASLTVGETGKAFLLGAGGEYISFFEPGKSIEYRMQDDGDEDLRRTGAYLTQNSGGQTSLKRGDGNKRVYFKTIADTGWILAIAVDENEISSSALNSIFILIVVPITGLVLSAVSIVFMARRLRRVTAKVNNFAELAADGDFDKRIEVTETDEFGVMEERLNAMISNMQAMSRHSAEMLEIAQAASRSKSDFLSRMSHEIRTPMNAIIGMTQIAAKSGDPDKIKECLVKIDNASRHLLALINDILDMSKIEANKLELVYAEFSLENVLTNIYNFVAVKVEEKHQSFTLNADKDISPYLIGDELRFSQVITNLLSNAVKFTPAGGQITLDIKQTARDEKFTHLEVSVSDSGIGMTEEQLSRLFKPFEQADGGTSRKYGGTGLGLAICKSIVELAGGGIRAESEPGNGSRFIFTAKFLTGAEKEARQALRDLSKLKVLAVDDNPETVDYLVHLMSASSITCEGAADGAQAVEKVRRAVAENKPYDIVFMDYMMPVMDGLKAAESIKALSESSIIIMISAYDLRGAGAGFERIGVSRFMTKPFSPSDIYNAINGVAQNIEKCMAPVPAPAVSYDFSGRFMLLAEDVDINREIVVSLLEDTGIRIESAENGRIAVDMFTAAPEKYDLILMDLQMPEMDGLEATRLIRALDKNIPIIAMTANAFKEDIDACAAAGMNGHIAKPVDYKTLIDKLAAFLAVDN